MNDQQPSGYIEYEGTLTKEQYEDLKRRFLEAQKTQPIRVIDYPEFDYPQEIRDQHESWLPQINAMIEQYESVMAAMNQTLADCGLPDGVRLKWQPIDPGN